MESPPTFIDGQNDAGTRGSDTRTGGIQIRVQPEFLPEHSDSDEKRWVFSYHIEIINHDDQAWTLQSREWTIIDGEGERHEVRGPGVVGLQPEVEPMGSFAYSSYCPLPTPWGTMEGRYRFSNASGEELVAEIGRFFLAQD